MNEEEIDWERGEEGEDWDWKDERRKEEKRKRGRGRGILGEKGRGGEVIGRK